MGRSAAGHAGTHAAGCSAVRPRGRRAGALALALAGATLVGAGVLSSWNVTTNVSSGELSAASGTVTLVDANGGRFTTGVADLLPGDFFHRYVDVRNDGTAANTFTGTVETTGELAGQVSVEVTACSSPWTTVAGVSTCLGTATPIGSGTPVTGAPVAVDHGRIGTGAAAAQHVRYRFAFSSTAPAGMQGKAGSVAISVSNTLVGGRDRTDD